MIITKKQLKRLIENYLLEENEAAEFLTDNYSQIISTAKKLNIIEDDAFLIIDCLETLKDKNTAKDEKELSKQKAFISYLCDIYSLSEERKSMFIAFWEKALRHVTNPALPFAMITASFGFIGLSFYLFIIFEILWVSNRDLYYLFAEFDHKAMSLLTLFSIDDFHDETVALIIENKEALCLNTLQMYTKQNSKIQKFTFDKKEYDFSGSQEAKTKAKNYLKSTLFDIVKNSFTKVLSDVLVNFDPTEIRKKEEKANQLSGGKAQIKFNTLDNL